MADILIRGVEMPQGKEVKVVMLLGKTARCNGKDYQVVELPPHGDLIDRDALPIGRVELEDIDDAPVIIHAEREDSND